MARRRPHIWQRLQLLATLTVAAGFLLLMPSRFTAPARVLFNEATGPVQTAAYQNTGKALAASGTLSEMFRKADRERALRREVERLTNMNAALAERLHAAQETIESFAALRTRDTEYFALRAPVSAYSTSAVSRSISVRAGRSDGVVAGLAVVAHGALVGIVSEAGPWQCRVRLITDPRSAVPCLVAGFRSVCILRGTGGGNCAVEWVSEDAFTEPGNTVYTTSLEADEGPQLRIPVGIPAATVVTAEPDRMKPLFLAVEATPRVNLDRLEAVEVLIPREPGAQQ